MNIEFRNPKTSDAPAIFELVKSIGLDVNSFYFYLMFTKTYAKTSLVALIDNKIAGFVLGLKAPENSKEYFCWQIGVAPWAQGQGLSKKLMHEIMQDFDVLTATVTPSNTPSNKLFQSMARDFAVDFEKKPYFLDEDFPDNHEGEDLYIISKQQRKNS